MPRHVMGGTSLIAQGVPHYPPRPFNPAPRNVRPVPPLWGGVTK